MTTAIILPFPLQRRVAFIERQASWLAGMNAKAADAVLFQQLQLQRDTLLRKGVDPATVETEVKGLESAIRGALWRTVLTGGNR